MREDETERSRRVHDRSAHQNGADDRTGDKSLKIHGTKSIRIGWPLGRHVSVLRPDGRKHTPAVTPAARGPGLLWGQSTKGTIRRDSRSACDRPVAGANQAVATDWFTGRENKKGGPDAAWLLRDIRTVDEFLNVWDTGLAVLDLLEANAAVAGAPKDELVERQEQPEARQRVRRSLTRATVRRQGKEQPVLFNPRGWQPRNTGPIGRTKPARRL